jgi:PEP-CTERM motif-containing protein
MIKTFASLAACAAIGLASTTLPGRAAIVDTFSFQNFGPYTVSGSGIHFDDVGFMGQFTGTVEPDGNIDLSSLSAFHADVFFIGSPYFFGDGYDLGQLSVFDFDPGGGATTLEFVATRGSGHFLCTGLAASFNPACADAAVTGFAAAIFFVAPTTAYTAGFTTVRLLSSVNTTPAAPEPSTWTMLTLGFAAMGWTGYRRSRARRSGAWR